MKNSLLIILLFTTCFASSQVNLSEGLEVYYPFSGNCLDASGNGYDGEVFGAIPAEDRYGFDESAYEFDGIDDYIDPEYPVLNSQYFSFCAWFKNYGLLNTGSGTQSLFGGRTGTTTSIISNNVQYNGNDSILIQIMGANGGVRPTIDTMLNLLDNQWHFWVLTSDISILTEYLLQKRHKQPVAILPRMEKLGPIIIMPAILLITLKE